MISTKIIKMVNDMPYVKEVINHGSTLQVIIESYCNSINIARYSRLLESNPDLDISYNRATNEVIIGDLK